MENGISYDVENQYCLIIYHSRFEFQAFKIGLIQKLATNEGVSLFFISYQNSEMSCQKLGTVLEYKLKIRYPKLVT